MDSLRFSTFDAIRENAFALSFAANATAAAIAACFAAGSRSGRHLNSDPSLKFTESHLFDLESRNHPNHTRGSLGLCIESWDSPVTSVGTTFSCKYCFAFFLFELNHPIILRLFFFSFGISVSGTPLMLLMSSTKTKHTFKKRENINRRLEKKTENVFFPFPFLDLHSLQQKYIFDDFFSLSYIHNVKRYGICRIDN